MAQEITVGGGGSSINEVKQINASAIQYTDQGGAIWLRSGYIEDDADSYPDATKFQSTEGEYDSGYSLAIPVESGMNITGFTLRDGWAYFSWNASNPTAAGVFRVDLTTGVKDPAFSISFEGRDASFLTTLAVDEEFLYVYGKTGQVAYAVDVYNLNTQSFYYSINTRNTVGETPSGIAVDDMWIYVKDTTTKRIVRFNKVTRSLDNSFQVSLDSGSSTGIAVDSDSVYVVYSNNITKYDKTTQQKDETFNVNTGQDIPLGWKDISMDSIWFYILDATTTLKRVSTSTMQFVGMPQELKVGNITYYTRIK